MRLSTWKWKYGTVVVDYRFVLAIVIIWILMFAFLP